MLFVKQKKIGNSFYVLIPPELRNEKLFLVKENELNNTNEDKIEELVKQSLTNSNNTNEEVLNRLDYLESKLIVEDTYRKEKIELQKFYEDYLLTKNVFYKMKKELGK